MTDAQFRVANPDLELGKGEGEDLIACFASFSYCDIFLTKKKNPQQFIHQEVQ